MVSEIKSEEGSLKSLKKEEEEKEVNVTDEKLKALLAEDKLDENEVVLQDDIFPMTINQFWLNFYEKDCPFTLKEFIEEHKGDFEFNLGEWKEGPPSGYENNQDGNVKLDLPDLDKITILSR